MTEQSPHSAQANADTEAGKAGNTLRGRAKAVIQLGLIAGFIGLSVSALQARSVAGALEGVQPALPVETVSFEPRDSYAFEERYAGVIEARQQSSLAFQLGGEIVSIAVDEGDQVAAGDVIAKLDTERLDTDEARLEALIEQTEADLELAKLTSERQRQLSEQGNSSIQAYDNARLRVSSLTAALKSAKAQLAAVRVDIKRSTLRAPYAGLIAARFVDQGDVRDRGMAVVDLLEQGSAQARVGVSPEAARAIIAGGRFKLTFGGQPVAASLAQARSDIDAATRTRALLFDIDMPQGAAFGELVSLSIDRDIAQPGGWLPAKALREGPRGMWLIYAIDDRDGEQSVRSEVVEFIYARGDQVYVRGALKAGEGVIAGGLHRVVAGQSVYRAATVELAMPAQSQPLANQTVGSR